MAGLWSQVSTYGASSDDLIRQAQTGDMRAYRELMRRGEILPPPGKPRFGQNARDDGGAGWRAPLNSNRGPEGMGLKYMPAIDGREEAPSYLGTGLMQAERAPTALEEGRGEQNMMRGRESQPAGLPFMPAIFGQQEAPDYLGIGMGQTPPATAVRPQRQSEITALANGNDAAASIQRGANAADQTAGVADPTSELPEPVKALTAAFMNEEDEDPYEGAAADLMKEITAGINPERNKNMALAQAGFAMAASGSPYFLQGVGVGGQAGLKSYQESQDRDTLARIRAAQIGTDLSQTRESKRSHRAQEGLELARQTETAAENQRVQGRFGRTQEEVERHNIQVEADNRAMRALQARGYKLEADRLEESRRQFEIMDDRYRRGEASEDDLKKAQTDYYRAQQKSTEALGIDRTTDIIPDAEDYLMRVSKEPGAKPEYILDEKGNKVKGQMQKPTAEMRNNKYWVDLGLFPDEAAAAAARMQGKAMTPDRRLAKAYEMADGALAYRPDLFGDAALQERERLAQQYYDVLGGDTAPRGRGAQYKTPDDVKRAYQNKQISKEEAAEEIRRMQAQ